MQTPGSIHEGGELGYALVHAAGAAFDHPDLIVACVVGDGEAETGPLAASWRLPAFLNPRRDGAVLPILHLNGYKIAGPTVLGRTADEDVAAYLRGQGWDPVVVAGRRPARGVPGPVRRAARRARADPRDAGRGPQRRAADLERPVRGGRRSCCAPRRAGPVPTWSTASRSQGTFRSHQVPLSGLAENPEHLRMLEDWLRTYEPERLFDEAGRLVPELRALAPDGRPRMSATPYANGGRLLRGRCRRSRWRRTRCAVEAPGADPGREHLLRPGELMRDLYAATARPDGGGTFRLFSPDETASNRLQAVFEETDRCFTGPVLATDDHLERRRPGDGGAERAPVPGLAGGVPPDRPARRVRDVRGVRDGVGVDGRAAREVAPARAGRCPGGRRWRRSTCCSPRPAGATTTTGSRTRARASSTRCCRCHPASSGCGCRRTPTPRCRSWTTACAAATT